VAADVCLFPPCRTPLSVVRTDVVFYPFLFSCSQSPSPATDNNQVVRVLASRMLILNSQRKAGSLGAVSGEFRQGFLSLS
jgi:hypothetical protein